MQLNFVGWEIIIKMDIKWQGYSPASIDFIPLYR